MQIATALAYGCGAVWKRTALALAMATALCSIGAAIASGATASTNPFATLAHPTVLHHGDAVVGPLPMAQPIHVVVALKLRNKDVLDALIAGNAKKQARGFPAQLMTSEQILANHAPTQAQAQAVANYLTGMGFTNVVIAPNRLLVSADGTALNARNAFLTTFAQVRTHDGRIAFANTDDVRIPVALQGSVQSVIGLQTVWQAHTYARSVARDAAHTNAITGHFPTEFPVIYGGTGVASASAVTVGIVTEGKLTQTRADLNSFTASQGLPTVTTQTVTTNGSSTDTANTNEWDLDSQDIVGMAGGQVRSLIFYNIPTLLDSDLTADFNTIEVANQAKIIDVSIGLCETAAQGDGSAAADDAIFALAVAQGQTFSISTGDSGADECGNGGTTPSWPAASQYVVAAAGTQLDASATTWNSETVWSGSGGSPSTFEPMPSWQTAFGVPGTKRVVADVAFDADPNSGAKIIVNGSPAQFGGTSLSAPLFAGVWARVLQQFPTIGFAGPVLYALPASAFHDITSGSNGGETASVGYDFASGRGSMILANVIAESVGLGDKSPVASFGFTTSTLTANFTDTSTDSDGTIVAHTWSFGDHSTSNAINPSHTYAAAGSYSVTDTVKDNDGATNSAVSVVQVSTVQQLLGNPGFESGTASPWSITPGVLGNNASLAHAGNWYAAVGFGQAPPGGFHTDHVSQTVSIPAGGASATLSFYLHVTTSHPFGRPDNMMSVNVLDKSTLLATLATYSNLDPSSGYIEHSFDMTPYLGRKVTLQFVGSTSLEAPTYWAIDDVSLVETQAQQLLSNSGFETGTASPWSITTNVFQNSSTLAHSGNWYADIGKGPPDVNGLHTDHVSQTVTIPGGKTSATLAFYLHVTTTDTSDVPDDKLRVEVYNTSGTLLATIATYSNLDKSNDYVAHSVDMTPYIGQKVTIKFLGTNGPVDPTDWLIDDLTLTVQ